jgi:tetratricopeptide (TPR) repeat protein
VAHNALRIFRNRPEYRFEGRLHEQIAHRLPTYATGRIEQTSVRVEHYGYLGAVRDSKEKSRRNIELLRAQQAENPTTAFLHFNLGTEYAAIGESRSALQEFRRAWALAKAEGAENREYTPALMSRLVSALRRCGQSREAIEQAEEGLRRFPGFTDLVFEQALASLQLKQADDAVAYWRRCIAMGDAPARYAATVGSGTYLPRIALAEVLSGRGELEGARELLEWCLTEHPDFIGVVPPYATVLLRSGTDPAAVVAQIEPRVARVTPAVRFTLASALHRHGAMEAAEQQYRQVLAARPHSAQIRVALAEALLHQRRYLDAATEASAVEGDDPFAALACRIELWGRIAGGDMDGARAAGDRARQAGVPAADLEMFSGWVSILRGEAAPAGLPIAATLLLGVILETLLETHDFTTFERLLPLLKASTLPEREQRESLGGMYLRHGFLASAAQEWMPVCQAEPDARALSGLARVALAHGQVEEAAVFADQALILDPESEPARRVLALCPAPAAGGGLDIR